MSHCPCNHYCWCWYLIFFSSPFNQFTQNILHGPPVPCILMSHHLIFVAFARVKLLWQSPFTPWLLLKSKNSDQPSSGLTWQQLAFGAPLSSIISYSLFPLQPLFFLCRSPWANSFPSCIYFLAIYHSLVSQRWHSCPFCIFILIFIL